MLSKQERVDLFRSLFRGREDVFARRWQKWNGSVAGYSPVYADEYKESYAPLTADWIEKHLVGTTMLEVYPLLANNTSNFIVADFDGKGWRGRCASSSLYAPNTVFRSPQNDHAQEMEHMRGVSLPNQFRQPKVGAHSFPSCTKPDASIRSKRTSRSIGCFRIKIIYLVAAT